MADCRKCGEKIEFDRIAGKWHAVNKDGSPHWRTCKAKNVLEVRKGPTIKGRDYKPSCGKCDVVPWKECECSFTAAEKANREADERMAAVLAED